MPMAPNGQKIVSNIYNNNYYQYETGTAMNARESENYLAISHSSSASKSVFSLARFYRANNNNKSSREQLTCKKNGGLTQITLIVT
jgi:hypothetical protein